jgi:hypothetical protein
MSKRHPSFDESYTAAQAHDTGNGAMSYTSTSPEFPGVICREIHVYAEGRGEDSLWYEASSDPARKEFSTPGAALRHTQSLRSIPDETFVAEAKRRGMKIS